jgi:hypothetical protein
MQRVRFGNRENMKKKIKKKLKIRNSFGLSLSTLLIRFDFDLVRIKFESFTVFVSSSNKVNKVINFLLEFSIGLFSTFLVVFLNRICVFFFSIQNKTIS